MAIKYYETYDRRHRHFGGIVCPSDFNMERHAAESTHGSSIAQRICSDRKWERSLLTNKNFNWAREVTP